MQIIRKFELTQLNVDNKIQQIEHKLIPQVNGNKQNVKNKFKK